MGVGDLGLGKFNIFGLHIAIRRPFFSRSENQWLAIKNRPITVLTKDNVLREGDIAQRDPGIAHSAHSFRNSVIDSSIIPSQSAVSCWIILSKFIMMMSS